jgi:hypothetical protein
MVVNNVAGWAGGGISLQDTVNAEIVNNTVAHNDSTATVGAAFISPTESASQVAGIVSEPHSPALAAAVPSAYSDPTAFKNNIIWENRSFRYVVNTTTNVGALDPVLVPTGEGACGGGATTYWDLGVIGGGSFSPTYSILTTPTAGTGNSSAPPAFVLAYYCNGARSELIAPGVTTLQTAPALDEGGNWIDVRFGPIRLTQGNNLTFFGNYHIAATSPAINLGTATGAPPRDYDDQGRITTNGVDAGADERVTPVPPLP